MRNNEEVCFLPSKQGVGGSSPSGITNEIVVVGERLKRVVAHDIGAPLLLSVRGSCAQLGRWSREGSVWRAYARCRVRRAHVEHVAEPERSSLRINLRSGQHGVDFVGDGFDEGCQEG
jgi:hypothetical protein